MERELTEVNVALGKREEELGEREKECEQHREERRALCAEVREMCGRLESRDEVVQRMEQWCTKALDAMTSCSSAERTQQEKGYLEEMLMKTR